MLSFLVSPVERPTSLPPLKTINVLCIWTLRDFNTSFWLSKSTLKICRSLKRACPLSSPRIGACALQVGHQGAVTSIRTAFLHCSPLRMTLA